MNGQLKEIPADAFTLLADPTRREMIALLSSDALTVSQIAAKLDLTAPTVYHHIKKMLAAGLVEVSHEERIGHLLESYYKSAADVFTSAVGQLSSLELAVDTDNVLKGLEEVGCVFLSREKLISRLAILEGRVEKGADIKELDIAIRSLKNFDRTALHRVKTYANLLLMSDRQFAQYLKAIEEIRNLLKSSCQVEEPLRAIIPEK